MEDVGKNFIEIGSPEWHEYAAQTVKDFSRRVTAQKKFYLLTPWGPFYRVMDFSETMDGFGYVDPRQKVISGKNFYLFDLLSPDEIKDLEIFSPQEGGEK